MFAFVCLFVCSKVIYYLIDTHIRWMRYIGFIYTSLDTYKVRISEFMCDCLNKRFVFLICYRGLGAMYIKLPFISDPSPHRPVSFSVSLALSQSFDFFVVALLFDRLFYLSLKWKVFLCLPFKYSTFNANADTTTIIISSSPMLY